MGGFGGFNEKKKKKQKQGGKTGNIDTYSSAPVFKAPEVIKKDRKQD